MPQGSRLVAGGACPSHRRFPPVRDQVGNRAVGPRSRPARRACGRARGEPRFSVARRPAFPNGGSGPVRRPASGRGGRSRERGRTGGRVRGGSPSRSPGLRRNRRIRIRRLPIPVQADRAGIRARTGNSGGPRSSGRRGRARAPKVPGAAHRGDVRGGVRGHRPFGIAGPVGAVRGVPGAARGLGRHALHGRVGIRARPRAPQSVLGGLRAVGLGRGAAGRGVGGYPASSPRRYGSTRPLMRTASSVRVPPRGEAGGR